MKNLQAENLSKRNTSLERLDHVKKTYGDQYPVIWYDSEIETTKKRFLKSLIQKNKSIYLFESYEEILQFAKSLDIKFILILSNAVEGQKFSQDFESLGFPFWRKMGFFEIKRFLEDPLKEVLYATGYSLKAFMFSSLSDGFSETPVEPEEEEVMIWRDINILINELQQEFVIIFYDPDMSSETKETLFQGLEITIEEKNYYKNLMDLLQHIHNYTGPPYHLIMSGKDLEENVVSEIATLEDLLGLYLFYNVGEFEKKAGFHEKLDMVQTLQELIPKIKQGFKTRSNHRNKFPAFATEFDAWDRNHFSNASHYLKGLLNFNNRRQAKSDFIQLAWRVYQDQEEMLCQFEEKYNEYDQEGIIFWFSRYSPVSRLIDDCLQMGSSDSILYSRFGLKDMETAVRDKYQKKDKDFNGLVFRGTEISEEEWNRLQKSIGQEIEIYNFFSTTVNKGVAINFLNGDIKNKVFITIIVPPLPGLDDQGFADISEFSEFRGEKEILFNIRSKFQVLQATFENIDENGTRARHLVLLYGVQSLRKYITQYEPAMSIELDFPLEGTIQCNMCRQSNNLFGWQQEMTTRIRCFDCLIESSLPKDVPILSLNFKHGNILNPIITKFQGIKLQFTQGTADFSSFGYKCYDCQVSGKQNYQIWITQDGKYIRQCFECFKNKKEIKAEILVSETYPYTIWLEGQKEWEKIDNHRIVGLSKDSQYESEGDVYFEAQDYDRCIMYCEKVLKRLELTRHQERRKMMAYKMLGTVYAKLEYYSRAETSFETALRLGELISDPIVPSLYHSLAEVQKSAGDLKEAEKNHQIALDLVKSMFGEESLEFAKSYFCLACFHESSGQLTQALGFFQTALDIIKRLLGEIHPETAIFYSKVANVYKNLKNNEKAIENFLQALKIRNNVFGKNHLETAQSYYNLAETFLDFSEYETAGRYFKHTIEILESLNGEKHLQTAAAYNGLGTMYEKIGEKEQALGYHNKTLEITRFVKGEINKKTVSSSENCRFASKNFEKFSIAQDSHMKALNIVKFFNKEVSPRLVRASKHRKLTYHFCSGEREKNLSFATESLEITRFIYGEMHKETALAYHNLGRTHKPLEKFFMVEEHYANVLNICKYIYGEEHLETALAHFKLGNVEEALGHNREAKENLGRAYQIRKKLLRKNHPDTIDVKKRLSSIYPEYPIVWFHPQINSQEKKLLRDFFRKKIEICCYSQFDQILKFAESNETNFILIGADGYDEQKLFQGLKFSKDAHMWRLSKFEEKSINKEFIKDIPDQILDTFKVYVFCTRKDFTNEVPRDESDIFSTWRSARIAEERVKMLKKSDVVSTLCDAQEIIRKFRNKPLIIWYDPKLESQNSREKLVEKFAIFEIEEGNMLWNFEELLIRISQQTFWYHLILTGKAESELIVNNLDSFQKLIRIYIYDSSPKISKIDQKTVKIAKTIEDLIPKIKEEIQIGVQEKFDLPNFTTVFDSFDRSHIFKVHYYLKELINFNNQDQARKDFIKLADQVSAGVDKKRFLEFKESYTHYWKEDILYWHTALHSLTLVLNNCLRIASADSILYCRFALKDMERAIREQFNQRSRNFNGKVYRAAYCSEDEWHQLSKNKGKEIEMYGFLSTSKYFEGISLFLSSDEQKNIIITIIIPSLPVYELDEQGYAELKEFTRHPREDEVLFNVKSKFRILEAGFLKIQGFQHMYECRHLVLLYGAHILRKYMTQYKPTVNVELYFPNSDLKCHLCGTKKNLLGFKQKVTQICCLDCLIKSSFPKDIPLLALDMQNMENNKIIQTIKGKVLRCEADFAHSSYECDDCKLTGKEKYFKWISFGGKNEIKQCSECLETKREIKSPILVSESSPFSFWTECQEEWEIISSNYKDELSKSQKDMNEGEVHFELQDYNRCIEYGNKFLDFLKFQRYREAERTRIYDMLGRAYEKLGRHEEALEYHLKALDIRKFFYGENHPETISSYHNLALVYQGQSNYQKTLEYQVKALNITKEVYGEQKPETAASYHYIASTYQRIEEHEKALESQLKALEIRKLSYGENHPETAKSYNNLALMYASFKEYDKALEYHNRALDILISIYGKIHPDVASLYNNIAIIYREKDENEEAMKLNKEALEIVKSVYGENHPRIGIAYSNIASTYEAKGWDVAALDYQLKALGVLKDFYDKSSPEMIAVYNSVILGYKNLKKFEKAAEYEALLKSE